MAQLRGSGLQHLLLPTHHSMLNWLSCPLAVSQTGFLDDKRAAGCSVMSELSGNLSFA